MKIEVGSYSLWFLYPKKYSSSFHVILPLTHVMLEKQVLFKIKYDTLP